MKYRQVCLYQLLEEWLVMSKIKHVEIKKGEIYEPNYL